MRRKLSKLNIPADVRGICGGRTPREFGGNLAQPVQLSTKLLDDEFDHPDSFMKTMADFFFDSTQCFLFTGKLGLQEFLSTMSCLRTVAGEACQERAIQVRNGGRSRWLAPVFAFQRGGENSSAFCSCGKDSALRTERRFMIPGFSDQPQTRQLFQRVINLRSRNTGQSCTWRRSNSKLAW